MPVALPLDAGAGGGCDDDDDDDDDDFEQPITVSAIINHCPMPVRNTPLRAPMMS